jgi:hypothetical protein
MGTERAAEGCKEGVRPIRRDRRVQRTVDLSDAEIAAVEAAEMMPLAELKAGAADS